MTPESKGKEMKTEDKPRFLLAAEELARQRGTDAQEILRRNREAIRNSVYPGPDCLVPDEIESFFVDPAGLEAERAEHARNCAGCSALLAGAGVNPAEIERLMTEVRSRPRVVPGPVLAREEAARPEGAESHPGRKVGLALVTLGSLLAVVGSLWRLFRPQSPPAGHTAPESEEAMAPVVAEEM
jgi:hypothetical protein